jgi:hypothetical protein
MMRQATSKMRGIRIALASCCLEAELFSLFALGLQRGQDHERTGFRPFKPKTLHFHRVAHQSNQPALDLSASGGSICQRKLPFSYHPQPHKNG